MWEERVEVFDAYRHELFTLRTILFWTINDFPAYGNILGYSVKGHKAYPICGENTFYVQLMHERKTVYLSTQRFLPMLHHYQKPRKAFNESTKEGKVSKSLNGDKDMKG